jgi:UDP-glucuronate 4-epimerase
MQDGDVPATQADVSALESDFGYRPQVDVEEGVKRFVEWYRSYYSKVD